MEKLGILGNILPYRIFGIIFFLVSLLYFFVPRVMARLGDWGTKPIWKDEWTMRHRITSGVFFLIVAVLLFKAGLSLKGLHIARLGLLAQARCYYILTIIFLLVGVGYFFFPRALRGLDNLGRKPIDDTPKVYSRHPKVMGFFFLIASLLLLWLGFFKL